MDPDGASPSCCDSPNPTAPPRTHSGGTKVVAVGSVYVGVRPSSLRTPDKLGDALATCASLQHVSGLPLPYLTGLTIHSAEPDPVTGRRSMFTTAAACKHSRAGPAPEPSHPALGAASAASPRGPVRRVQEGLRSGLAALRLRPRGGARLGASDLPPEEPRATPALPAATVAPTAITAAVPLTAALHLTHRFPHQFSLVPAEDDVAAANLHLPHFASGRSRNARTAPGEKPPSVTPSGLDLPVFAVEGIRLTLPGGAGKPVDFQPVFLLKEDLDTAVQGVRSVWKAGWLANRRMRRGTALEGALSSLAGIASGTRGGRRPGPGGLGSGTSTLGVDEEDDGEKLGDPAEVNSFLEELGEEAPPGRDGERAGPNPLREAGEVLATVAVGAASLAVPLIAGTADMAEELVVRSPLGNRLVGLPGEIHTHTSTLQQCLDATSAWNTAHSRPCGAADSASGVSTRPDGKPLTPDLALRAMVDVALALSSEMREGAGSGTIPLMVGAGGPPKAPPLEGGAGGVLSADSFRFKGTFVVETQEVPLPPALAAAMPATSEGKPGDAAAEGAGPSKGAEWLHGRMTGRKPAPSAKARTSQQTFEVGVLVNKSELRGGSTEQRTGDALPSARVGQPAESDSASPETSGADDAFQQRGIIVVGACESHDDEESGTVQTPTLSSTSAPAIGFLSLPGAET